MALVMSSTAAVGDASAATPYTPPAQRPAMIVAGYEHTLALTPAGTVRTWGRNVEGELGDGSTGPVSTPVSVVGVSGSAPLDHVVQVAAGTYTSYALRSDGTVVAWGNNTYDQFGSGSTVSSTRPVRVVSTSGTGALSGVVAIAAGDSSALALLSNHTVVAWGYGQDGELGNGSTSDSAVPVVVHGVNGAVLTGIVGIAGGYKDFYAVSSSGAVYSWGDPSFGALGANDSRDQSTPGPVAGVGGAGTLSHVVSVAAGVYWAMGLLSDGTVVSWGHNGDGELGNGTTSDGSVPSPVSGLGDHIASIGAGNEANAGFAISADGALYGWGENTFGQLGNGTTSNSSSPLGVTSLGGGSAVTQVSGGYRHTVVVTASGAVRAWGDNETHQIGDGSAASWTTPTRPYGLPAIGLPKLFLVTAPVLGGSAKTGHTLSVTAGTWGLPATSHGYQWLRDGKAIKGATKSSYKLVAADRKHRVSVRVSAGRAGYPGNSTTTRSVAVA